MRKNRWLFGWFLGFFLLFSRNGIAGVYIEEINRDLERVTKVIRYFSNHQFRTDLPEYGVSTIIDFKNDRMTIIYHPIKRYEEIRFSQWEKGEAERVKKSQKEKERRGRKVEVRNTGEVAIINGFRTEKVQLFIDGELVEENYMTKEIEAGEMEKVMERIAKLFMKDLRREMREGQEIYMKLKAHGFPVLIKDYQLTYGLSPIVVMEIIKFEKREFKEEVFLPPPNYQRIPPKEN